MIHPVNEVFWRKMRRSGEMMSLGITRRNSGTGSGKVKNGKRYVRMH